MKQKYNNYNTYIKNTAQVFSIVHLNLNCSCMCICMTDNFRSRTAGNSCV